MKPLVEKAREIATIAHEGQFRRDGTTPYINHPEAVVQRVGSDERLVAAAWLHDVLEDTTETRESLLKKGIPDDVVRAVERLTKSTDLSYDQYLAEILKDAIATRVKIADMLANLADRPTEKQIRKYATGLLTLVPEEHGKQ